MDERACIMSKKYDQMKKRIYDLELLVGLQPTPVSTLNPCNSACEEITMNTANATVTLRRRPTRPSVAVYVTPCSPPERQRIANSGNTQHRLHRL